uniref:Short chain dehydrogenase/reductase family 16C member 5 n=1 Tax=Rousettus aegyptiacus TaxID=9407 RepID=A0A7J8C446_ROUAE|nr:short chain dehydrogenase/reductase family 16C member 5 [Rousettus aegyptiacus]
MEYKAHRSLLYLLSPDPMSKVKVFRGPQTYKAFLPAMLTNDHGHLVCISSIAGLIGIKKLTGKTNGMFHNCTTSPNFNLHSSSE